MTIYIYILINFGFSEYYFLNTTEELEATLSCVQENEPYYTYTGYEPPPDPYIIIDSVRYVFFKDDCNHSDAYGIKDMCENKTDITFNVTNTIVASSCGYNGLAGLYIVYHCISKFIIMYIFCVYLSQVKC